jgi:beta-lactamase class D
MRCFYFSILLFTAGSALLSCSNEKKKSELKIKLDVVRNDFEELFNQNEVTGSFVMYDENNDLFTFVNQDQFKTEFTPASTFKICNSLIGLETGVIRDQDFVIPWDKVERNLPVWNKDHDLKSAFKNSTVWYYQELARRVGGDKMKFWLNKCNYGNADTTGGIDRFWLTGGLRITPEKQLDFLGKLKNNQLPFSQRSMDITKEIMISKDTLDYVLRTKTGWGEDENQMVGWYIGYIEKENNTYYFATCIQTTDFDDPGFAKKRLEITNKILSELKLLN